MALPRLAGRISLAVDVTPWPQPDSVDSGGVRRADALVDDERINARN
jgi:hypothetical protein